MNQESNNKKPNTKPVVTYILILFTAAFILMTFSLLATQRNNDQTLDEMRDSISSIEEGQTAQDHVMSMQDEITRLQEEIDILNTHLSDLEDENQDKDYAFNSLEQQYDCLELLFHLQMQYQLEDYTGCLITMQTMEEEGLVDLLPTTGTSPTPAEEYQTIKLAVLNA